MEEPPKKSDDRYHRKCPIPGCRSKAQKKLPNHFDHAHKNLSKKQREYYLSVAKRVPKKDADKPVMKKLKGQLTMDQCFKPPAPEVSSGEEDGAAKVSGTGTRGFPRYDIKQETTLISFRHHLTSIDGKDKSEKVADQMAIDVSKFLRFACGEQVVPDWRRLLDRDQIMAFVDKLERHGCGPDGKVTKLDALDAALRFFRLELLKDDTNNALHMKSLQMTETIKGWKATLRKQKTRKRIQRLEELSSDAEALSLESVEAIIHCDSMWDDFTTIADRLGKGLSASDSELNRCTVMVATVLTFRSWQRPGAAYNLTLDEWEKRSETGDGVVIKVLKHKTGLSGSARVVLTPGDYSKVLAYATTMRLFLDPENKSPYLLCLSGGRQMANFNSRFKTLSQRYGFEPMTATRVRKIAATEAALKLSGPEAALVTKQLSHTPETDAKYYQALTGPQHAAFAVKCLSDTKRPAITLPIPQPMPPIPDNRSSESRVDPPAAASPVKTSKKKRRFTPEENETIQLYFEDYVREQKTPVLDECKAFVENHPMGGRTKQQIQDKVKDLIKRAILK